VRLSRIPQRCKTGQQLESYDDHEIASIQKLCYSDFLLVVPILLLERWGYWVS